MGDGNSSNVESIAEKLAAYLQQRMPSATVSVLAVTRLHGGGSPREMYRARVRGLGEDPARESGIVVRLDARKNRFGTLAENEYKAYEAAHRLGLPVPRPLVFETDVSWLGRSFMVMEEIRDCTTGALFAPQPFGPHAEKIGVQLFTELGRLAAAEPEKALLDVMKATPLDGIWRRELDHWETILDEDARSPDPVVRAAIRWLKRNPPPPAQKLSLVHGDYRAGNCLYNANGEVKAIVDWELAHLGDALEDLGWIFDPMWSIQQPDLVGGMITKAQACHIWEQASGMKINPQALAWWELFNQVKGVAITVAAEREFRDGVNTDPLVGVGTWISSMVCREQIARKLVSFNEKSVS